MTKPDFFRIIFKIFGLYSIILTVFTYIPSNIGYFTYELELIVLLWIFLATVITVGLYILLILKTDTLIDWLKIDEGFDDDTIVLGNFNSRSMVKFALIIISLFLIIDYLPTFIHHVYLAFKKEVSPNGLNMMETLGNNGEINYYEWSLSAMNIIVGFIIITNYNKLARWIDGKNKV